MKTFFDAFLTSIAILLAVPAVLILASWNALPGDSLYSVKTSLEKVAMAVTSRTPLASGLSLKFTDRRFGEANRLLAREGSTLGYTLLVNQATQSKEIVVEKQDVKQAKQLIENIETYQKSIEEKKTALAAQPSAIIPPSVPVSTPTPVATTFVPTNTPTPVAATPIPQPTSAHSVEAVVTNLDQTSSQLEELRQEIIRELPDTESIQHNNQGQHENQGQGRDKDKNKDKND